jgi:hypothetical protein
VEEAGDKKKKQAARLQEQYQVDRWGMVEASGMGGHDIDGLCLSLLMSLSPSLSLSLSPSETETLIW